MSATIAIAGSPGIARANARVITYEPAQPTPIRAKTSAEVDILGMGDLA
jgi:hypothetical protein